MSVSERFALKFYRALPFNQIVNILGVSSAAFAQADALLNKGASEMTQASSSSSGSGDVVSGAVDLTLARVQESAGVHVANAQSEMNKALLDIFV